MRLKKDLLALQGQSRSVVFACVCWLVVDYGAIEQYNSMGFSIIPVKCSFCLGVVSLSR